MPVVIKLTFPGGRYHATLWGRHVNEGVPEWPPSPWRLLRALVAVWKRTCPHLPEDSIKRVLEQLVHPPLFHLPPHSVAHTRHYMPWEKKGPQDRTLVFDTFVSVGRNDPLLIGWLDAKLAISDCKNLAELLGNLTSLGRAEGWVHAELTNEQPPWNCVPAQVTESNPALVFCPDPATVFDGNYYPTIDPKKLAKGKVPLAEFLFDCPRWHLCLDTETIHGERWQTVPGAKWVTYTRPTETIAPMRQTHQIERSKPTVVRFLLDGPVLPLVTDIIRLAEAIRRAAMSRFRYWCERHPDRAEPFRRTDDPTKVVSQIFSGKDAAGVPLQDHAHAHYLLTAEGTDPRRITHVTLWAPNGFGPNEVSALNRLRELRCGELRLRVQLIGLGKPGDLRASIFQPSLSWVSATPFVAHRHLKRRGQKKDTPHLRPGDPRSAFLELAIRELIQRRDIGSLTSVEVTTPHANQPRPFEFHRSRERDSGEGFSRAFGWLKLRFTEPIQGPLCLGYACHFGMGLFIPIDEKEATMT